MGFEGREAAVVAGFAEGGGGGGEEVVEGGVGEVEEVGGGQVGEEVVARVDLGDPGEGVGEAEGWGGVFVSVVWWG